MFTTSLRRAAGCCALASFALAGAALAQSPAPAHASGGDARLTLQPGDRVILIGNTLLAIGSTQLFFLGLVSIVFGVSPTSS